MESDEVFTPYSFPEYTYVQRADEELEDKLRAELNQNNRVVSLSGPSKSGKKVLVQQVVDDADDLMIVPGSKVDTPSDVGDHILDQLGIPDSTEARKMASKTFSEKLEGSVQGILGFLSSKITGGTTQAEITEFSQMEVQSRNGISQAVEELKSRDIVLFIDDFHYIDREIQEEIAEMVKDAMNRGLTICTALVPHRGDDLQRANSDLRGRVWGLEIKYWEKSDLVKIAYKEFKKLNVEISNRAAEKMAEEASGSPQLMQQMCLEACKLKGIDSKYKSNTEATFDDGDIEMILKKVVGATDHQSTVEILDRGPKTRGKERINMNLLIMARETSIGASLELSKRILRFQ